MNWFLVAFPGDVYRNAMIETKLIAVA